MSTKTEPPALTLEVQQMQARQARLKQIREEDSKAVKSVPVESLTTYETRKCVGCDQDFTAGIISFEGKEICSTKYCETCVEIQVSEEEEEAQRKRDEAREAAFLLRWSKICPPLYAQPWDLQKALSGIKESFKKEYKGKDFPNDWREKEMEARAAIKTTQEFPYSEKGLGLVGFSGNAKTRLMFTLINRLMREGHHCSYINLAEFGGEAGAKFSEGASVANNWIKSLCKVPVLFLDDVGKEKMTERVETELYRIVEMRTCNLLPIYFTANFGGDRLIEKMTGDDGEISDRAVPIVRRLRKYCELLAL